MTLYFQGTCIQTQERITNPSDMLDIFYDSELTEINSVITEIIQYHSTDSNTEGRESSLLTMHWRGLKFLINKS